MKQKFLLDVFNAQFPGYANCMKRYIFRSPNILIITLNDGLKVQFVWNNARDWILATDTANGRI